MKENKRSIFVYVLFFGAIWGILEATLGYVLHFLPALVAGSIMFPIGALIMMMTLGQTKSKSAMILVAAVAASIKAVNFFMPGLPIIKTYNPMIAIMLQSLVLYAIVPMMEKKPLTVKLIGITLVSISWRLFFVLNLVINTSLTGIVMRQLATTNTIISFVLISGLVDAAILAGMMGLRGLVHKNVQWMFKPSLIISLATFIFAVVINIVL